MLRLFLLVGAADEMGINMCGDDGIKIRPDSKYRLLTTHLSNTKIVPMNYAPTIGKLRSEKVVCHCCHNNLT